MQGAACEVAGCHVEGTWPCGLTVAALSGETWALVLVTSNAELVFPIQVWVEMGVKPPPQGR